MSADERAGAFEPAARPSSGLGCWFCTQPAVTIGYGFATCGGRPDGEMNCSERARELFRASLREAVVQAQR